MVEDAQKTLANGKGEKNATRDGFGSGMMILGEKNPDVVALCADLTDSDRLKPFREKYPDRFVEVGIAEQNLVGVACGMAHVGKIPFTASFAAFNPGRSWDQIRVSGCYSNNNLKIYGGHAGLTVGEDGATHQALEDIAIMRVLPRMRVIVPCDALEMEKATLAAAETPGPVYLRGGRAKTLPVTTKETPFVVGKANLLQKGSDLTIIACGILVSEALKAAEMLKKEGIKARVLNMHTIKPLDLHGILDAAHETGAIVTAEEHQIHGGLGSAVAEIVTKNYPVPIEMVGVKDTFGESGTADSLLDAYGLRAKNIVIAAMHVLERKNASGKKRKLPNLPSSKVYATKSGSSYHVKGCSMISGKKGLRSFASKKVAAGKKLSACSHCFD